LLIFEIPQVKYSYKVNRIALIVGSLFPDLIDKPLEIIGLSSGKGYFHTLTLGIICFLILFLISKFNTSISFPFFIGFLLHLLLDIPVPFFYPFLPYDFVEIQETPISFWYEKIFAFPFILLTEITGLIILLFILIRNRLFNFSKILGYLKTDRFIVETEKKELLIIDFILIAYITDISIFTFLWAEEIVDALFSTIIFSLFIVLLIFCIIYFDKYNIQK
jgi:hypothetical protein